jgi:isopentenyl diphosphate isomerase/L-lactate dehydrogenase-like FMN-dependent dehydrogenase
MFFRLKATATGQVVKLLESYRDGAGKSRHRTVASLGNASINWEERRAIAKAVAGRLYGQGELVVRDLSEEAGQWVDRIVRQVSREGRWRALEPLHGAGERIEGVCWPMK